MAVVGLEAQLQLVRAAGGRQIDLLPAIDEDPSVESTIDGASTLELVVADYRRELVASPWINERSWAVVAGIHYELVAVGKSGDHVTLTFEDAIVAALRRWTSPRSFAARKFTRRGIVERLAKEAGVGFQVDPANLGTVNSLIARSSGKEKTTSWDVLGSDVAEPVAWRRFSDGRRLVVGGDPWLMGRKHPRELREHVDGVTNIDFDADVAKQAQTATVTLDTDIGAFTPGDPVQVAGLGPGAGLWLVESVHQKVTSPRGTLDLTRQTTPLKEPKAQRGAAKRESGDPDFLPGKGGTVPKGTAGSKAREKMVAFALAQKGKPYVWGASGPGSYDCSGLVQAATRHAGRALGKPAASQWAACRVAGKTIPVATALKTRGALLFRIGAGKTNHVAISLGNGSTVEAKGSAYGCGVFGGAAGGGWTGAALWL